MNFAKIFKSTVLVGVAVAAQAAFAFELTPKKAGVSLRAKPTVDGPVVKVLQGNERLKVTSKSGLYWAVTLGADKGFVLSSEVQPLRSNEESNVRSGFKSAIQGNKGNQKRTRSAVMGIRGLDDAEEISNKSGDRNNPNATQKMESRPISKDSLNRLEESVNKENEELNNKN